MNLPEPNYNEAVSIDGENINGEFIRLSADLAYYHAAHAEAVREANLGKLASKNLEGHLKIAFRAQLEDAGRKVTIPEVDSAVQSDPDYQQSLIDEINLEYEKIRLAGIIDAIRAKKDMLVSYGAQMRAEMQADPFIRTSSDSQT